MSRSGYSDDLDQKDLAMWRGQVRSSIRGKRGQAFLRELAKAMDAMPVKELIFGELVDGDNCCTIGVVCKARKLDVSAVDPHDPEAVGDLVGIARQLAAEIEYENDDNSHRFERQPDGRWKRIEETPAERWQRMRKWVESHIKKMPSEQALQGSEQ